MKKIVVTGAAGFIGSCLVSKLNNEGIKDIILVDDFSNPEKNKNFKGKSFVDKVDRFEFVKWLDDNHQEVSFIYHLGARTDTTEFNTAILDKLNLNYSKSLWQACAKYDISLIYASSAATYGDGKYGYKDDHDLPYLLKPLNPYGDSKNDFDKWALKQEKSPDFWVGFKFFNVFGPNEYHKGRMASVIMHSYHQILKTGKVKLFRSHNPDYKDGMQLRDFIYVKDVVDVLYRGMINKPESGLYNLGTGIARSFLDLILAIYSTLKIKEDIEFVDIPEDIRDKYQYFTEADVTKLLTIDKNISFSTLEEGVADYVEGYLKTGEYC